MSILTGRAFAKALEEAGVVSDVNTIARIVIDVQAENTVQIYVQRSGDTRVLDIAGLLGTMMADAETKTVRYWVPLSADLLGKEDLAHDLKEAGLRVAEFGPWRDPHTRMVRIEDPDAPQDLDGQEVELILEREGDGPVRVKERNVLPAGVHWASKGGFHGMSGLEVIRQAAESGVT